MTLTAYVKPGLARVSKLYGKGPHPVLRTASRAARRKLTVSGIPNCLIDSEFLQFIYNLQKLSRVA